MDWHLEFTQNENVSTSQFDEDDLMVFYPDTELEYSRILQNLTENNIPLLQAKNPYWNENGICFEDCDGYKIIISRDGFSSM